jgi:hypothetical protein
MRGICGFSKTYFFMSPDYGGIEIVVFRGFKDTIPGINRGHRMKAKLCPKTD